jgi:hypothetical protein
VDKPCGYSLFANEILPVPKSWAELSCNLVWFRKHDRGGHFAVRLTCHPKFPFQRQQDWLIICRERSDRTLSSLTWRSISRKPGATMEAALQHRCCTIKAGTRSIFVVAEKVEMARVAAGR